MNYISYQAVDRGAMTNDKKSVEMQIAALRALIEDPERRAAFAAYEREIARLKAGDPYASAQEEPAPARGVASVAASAALAASAAVVSAAASVVSAAASVTQATSAVKSAK